MQNGLATLGKISIITLFALLISGCTNVAISGAQAVYNRHSIQKDLKDQYITLQAYRSMSDNPHIFKNTNISVATLNQELLLTGQTPSKTQRFLVESTIKKSTDAKHVYNLISINSPSSTLTRISDAWLTTKIKSKLIASQDVDATQVKVLTENSVVYLMGTLEPDAALAATEIASNTDGVTDVVKIFSYIRITKA